MIGWFESDFFRFCQPALPYEAEDGPFWSQRDGIVQGKGDVEPYRLAIHADLTANDLEFVEMRLSRDPQPEEKAVLVKLKSLLENEKFIFKDGLTPADQKIIAAYTFLTNKPVATATETELQNPDALLRQLLETSGHINFLTVGGKENRAWLIKKGSTAWDAAGAIHSDIQKGFIRAEIISFDDLIQAGGETQAKRAGKQRLEMKPYIVQDYDVVNFRFNK